MDDEIKRIVTVKWEAIEKLRILSSLEVWQYFGGKDGNAREVMVETI